MAVNNMTIEQAYQLIRALHKQATGFDTVQPVDTSTFTSVAQTTLKAGYDTVLQAITQVISKTLIAVRPYSRKFKGLEITNERWGGIIRKINFADMEPEQDPTYELNWGPGPDQFEIQKPYVVETRYVGSDVYECGLTIFTKQLDVAFSGPEAFAEFMSGLMTHFSNVREQWLESVARSVVINAVTGINDSGTGYMVHLLSEYNSVTGLSLTVQDIRQPANMPAFCKWAYARIQGLSNMMTERSEMFHMPVTGFYINRHTPLEDQRFLLNADFLAHMTSEVLADTYHDNFLRFANVEPVAFWQAIDSPLSMTAKPVYIDGDGAVKVAANNVSMSAVLGVLFDRDAMGYNIYDDSLEASPYNAKGQYYNLYSHVRVQTQNDFTENMIVFCLD